MPKGTVKQMPSWESKIFSGTTRDWWVYVPAQYKPETPAAVMVFQDGAGPKDYVPTVFDNLIAKRDMPVTVGIFIQPGVFADGRANRSFEYDTLSDQYARFLLEEILPEVEKTVKLRHDAASRAISGRQQRRHLRLHRRVGAARRVQQGAVVDRQLHEHRQRQDASRGRPQLRGDGPQDCRRSRFASSCRTARTISTTRTATGRSRTRRWRSHSPSRGTTIASNSARASTATATAAPSCPIRCAGCGAGTSRRAAIRATKQEHGSAPVCTFELMPAFLIPLLVSLLQAQPAPSARLSDARPAEGDFVIRNFKFTSGETLPELRMHYRTLGTPREERAGRRAATPCSSCTAPAAPARSSAGRTSPASCSVPASRSTLAGTSSSCPTTSATASRASRATGCARSFPRYGYVDMVEARASAGHRGARRQPPAAGDGHVDGRHAHVAVGRALSRLHGRADAARQPAGADLRPQPRLAARSSSTRSATIPSGRTATTRSSRGACARRRRCCGS